MYRLSSLYYLPNSRRRIVVVDIIQASCEWLCWILDAQDHISSLGVLVPVVAGLIFGTQRVSLGHLPSWVYKLIRLDWCTRRISSESGCFGGRRNSTIPNSAELYEQLMTVKCCNFMCILYSFSKRAFGVWAMTVQVWLDMSAVSKIKWTGHFWAPEGPIRQDTIAQSWHCLHIFHSNQVQLGIDAHKPKDQCFCTA